MAENSAYFIAVTGARALVTQSDSNDYDTSGDTLSLETQNDLMGESIYSYVWNNFPDFLTNIRHLSEEDQEFLLSYYILGKTQTSLAIVNKSTQTICSTKIRMAVKRLGAHIILGEITEASLEQLFSKFDKQYYEKDPSVPLSKLIHLYAKLGSAQEVADVLGLYRPDVRRSITNLAKELMDSPDLQLSALGAVIQGLIDKASSSGHGPSKSRMLARGNMFRKDPDVLGEFEVDVTNPGFKDVLYPRANQ
jgi:hypothetical protein